MGERVTQTELARRLGISESAVRKHIERGLYKRGKDGLIDADYAREMWEANRDPDAVLRGVAGAAATAKGTDPSGPPETTLSRARTAQAAFSAKLTALKLQKETGEVIAFDEAVAAARLVVTMVCERLDGCAAQIAARVVGLDAVATERVAREVINAARAEVAGLAEAVEGVAHGRSQS